MTFTDDDLKRLKNGMSTLRMAMNVTEYSLGKEELEALIARLEAAEKVCLYNEMGAYVTPVIRECLKSWRKTVGK